MRVHVDRDVCEIHAQCVFAAPEVFDLDADDELVYDPAPAAEHGEAVRQAERLCPVRAITLTEE
ncbi:ferredoxin [Allokutzneria albata]|uniref:Ferredoxin n=1 Tax=Allokutzneria albata TaxID=211114 RepID=A0A1G9WG14_ALLAB|nr:ferredoxin [Allokutzneria albata]SDM83247.1 Ferredoxin [Allokutzneria albata]